MTWKFKIRSVKFKNSNPSEQKWLFLASKMPKEVIQTLINATLPIFGTSGRHKLLEILRFGFFGHFRHCALQENICTSIMKIVIAFSDTIDNDFRRVEMRPYFERFQKILAN